MRAVCLLLAALVSTVAAPPGYSESPDMQAAREALYRNHGNTPAWLLMGERLEYHSAEGDPELVWEAQGWYGGDRHKLWLKSEGEYDLEEGRFGEAELQTLYSKAVRPFWDLQMGIRQDIKPDPSRSYAVLGLQGTAPYWFELDAALFLSNKGDLSARLEAEYELRLSQRLLLQPRLELNAAFSGDRSLGVGSGLRRMEAGLRLRYEITPELAPYLGVAWSQAYGNTAALSGRNANTSLVAGVRFWL